MAKPQRTLPKCKLNRPLPPLLLVRLLVTRRRGSLYIGGVWIRQPQELHRKCLLLVMGMVGCEGGSSHDGKMASPDAVVTTPVQVTDADPVAALEELEAKIERDTQGGVIEIRLFSTKITDAEWVHLGALTELYASCPRLPCA